MLVLLTGLAISVLLNGRSERTKLLFVLARLLGRLSLLSRLGTGPNESLEIPDVDSLATCLAEGVVSSVIDVELAELPTVRFLLLIVTLGGI